MALVNIFDGEWTLGWINMSTGALEGTNASYPNARYSSPIELSKGVRYEFGNIAWRLRRWRPDGSYINNSLVEIRGYTPSEDEVVRILQNSAAICDGFFVAYESGGVPRCLAK